MECAHRLPTALPLSSRHQHPQAARHVPTSLVGARGAVDERPLAVVAHGPEDVRERLPATGTVLLDQPVVEGADLLLVRLPTFMGPRVENSMSGARCLTRTRL